MIRFYVVVLNGLSSRFDAGFDTIDLANEAAEFQRARGTRVFVEARDVEPPPPTLERTARQAVAGLADRRCREIRWAGVAP